MASRVSAEVASRIWKFPLDPIKATGSDGQIGEVIADVPFNTDFLYAGVDRTTGVPTVWGLVQPDSKMMKRKFHIYGTGHPIEDEFWHYIGTVQVGPFVWHIGWVPK